MGFISIQDPQSEPFESTLNFRRPFRPRQPAEQAGDDQPQQSSAEEQLQGEDRQTEDTKIQANGDVAAAQRQQRSVRRRRQRNSESSTSKVSLREGLVSNSKVQRVKSPLIARKQNDTEKSASEPGSPQQNATTRTPQASPKISPEEPKSEVKS